MNNEINRRAEQYMNDKDAPLFTISKPYIDSQLRINNNDSVLTPVILYDSILIFNENIVSGSSWLKRKLLKESFIQIDSNEFYIFADPVFDFTYGKESSGKTNMSNIRGFSAGLQIGKSFGLHIDFYENSSSYNTIISRYILHRVIVPGQGRKHNYSGESWDVSNSSGYISFTPLKCINIQLGHGKNFIGDGYRSLLLSDISYNYPYFKATWAGKNLYYSWMIASTQNIYLDIIPDREPFENRIITSHVFSFNASKRIQISAIKCDIYDSPDSLGRMNSTYKIFNPLPIPYNNKLINSLYGFNLRINLNRNFVIYNQWVFDNLPGEGKLRNGMQVGMKYYSAFSVKNLFLQAEYNMVKRYVYNSEENTLRWMHFGEPLAHPYGNNISEGYINVNYSWRRLQLNTQLTVARPLQQNESATIPKNRDFPYLVNGTKILHQNSEIRFYVNPKTLAHFFVGYTYHEESNNLEPTLKMSYLYFGARTMLKNFYTNY